MVAQLLHVGKVFPLGSIRFSKVCGDDRFFVNTARNGAMSF